MIQILVVSFRDVMLHHTFVNPSSYVARGTLSPALWGGGTGIHDFLPLLEYLAKYLPPERGPLLFLNDVFIVLVDPL